ncbi:MAG: hypothetical protein A3H97_09505 [Acidobacteria bacterium RIFCSPLOWO2_02_FULL_65_29]|nr:MAG: hypothetical protein A3H97_09505 [Acidobacteria bacterium RIFCSPLOWO2_02_FULL_65_29]
MSASRRSAATAAGAAAFGLGVWLGAIAVRGQERTLQPGDPLPGISAVEFSEFRLGLDDFTEVETSEDGLGPAFNGTSCAVCHDLPAIGGGGVMLETRAAIRDQSNTVRGLNAAGDTLVHMFSTPNHTCQAVMPPDTNIVARRAPIPLFGAGLVEAIADETLLALEDPLDLSRDGVSGRAAIVTDVGTGARRVGRFGWKSQQATLLTFGADAYRNEMGITNDLFPQESAVGVTPPQMRLCDPRPDPEDARDPLTGKRGIDNFEAFMKFLAPVGRAAIDETVRSGERVFAAIGCAACHVPSLTTGPSSHPAFNRKPVPLFSDLLLHDVGTGDGIRQESAEPEEIRTPALWGLRFRRPLLHDGRAADVQDAIRAHRNEADLARQGFAALTPSDAAALLAFLRSL